MLIITIANERDDGDDGDGDDDDGDDDGDDDFEDDNDNEEKEGHWDKDEHYAIMSCYLPLL